LTSIEDFGEASLVLNWWAESEAAAGCFERATELATRALEWADDDTRMYLTSNIAAYAFASDDFQRAAPFVDEALALAKSAKHPLAIAIAIAYRAGLRAGEDPREAARLFGYARARFDALHWIGTQSDELVRENIGRRLGLALDANELAALLAQGAAWTEDEALTHAGAA
jgi:hypothetical protein